MSRKSKYDISIVFPLYNESNNIHTVFENTRKVMLEIDRTFEIIFINDGSEDNSLDILTAIQEKPSLEIDAIAVFPDDVFNFSKTEVMATALSRLLLP